ncbi:MAG: ABC transporter permease [Bryobacterales bacterium]|nr:ABC transporter permease [Bryobacterales bacterium]
MTRAFAILIRQFYLFRGSPARVIAVFSWVAIDITLWGFITRYLNTVASPGFNFVPALLGAVLLWDFFVRVMQGVTMTFFEDVWSRNFLNIFASPMSIGEYLGGLVLSSVTTSFAALAFMLILSTAVFGLQFFSYGAAIVPFVAVLFLFGISLGIVASAIVLRLGPSAEWFIWPIPALISPFAGVFYPITTLPSWMQAVSRVLPPSYVFESIRAIVKGGEVRPADLALSIILAVAYILAASFIFLRTYRHAVRTGLIARYSAESLS